MRYRFSTRLEIVQYLLSHPCVDCGEKDPIVLDFDHIKDDDPDKLHISSMRNGHSSKRLQEEMAKCVVRCANCHRRKHSSKDNWRRQILDALST